MATVRGILLAPGLRPNAAGAGPPQVRGAAIRVDPEEHLAFRRVSLFAGLILLFMRVGNIQQLQTYLVGFNLPLLYIIAVPAIIGTVLCGGIRRVFRARPGFYWAAFGIWLVMGVPFSSWLGGSLSELSQFLR